MGSNLLDCLENWSLQVSNIPRLPVIVCWYVWITCNKAIFENLTVSIDATCFRILGELKSERLKKITAPRFIQPLTQLSGNYAWFDGASQNLGMHCGVGGRIHLCDGFWITWTFNCGIGSNTKTKLLGVWVTLLLASRYNILDLHVRRDSKIIIDWLNKKGKLQIAALECWKDRIIDLSQTFT